MAAGEREPSMKKRMTIMLIAVFGLIGAVFLSLKFPVSPIVLGFVLGPMLEENFRRAMLLSRGELGVFIDRPISAWFIGACCLLVLAQLLAYGRKLRLRSARRGLTALTTERGR